MATRISLTYGDYAAIPDDGKRYELHEGEGPMGLPPFPDLALAPAAVWP